MNSVKKQMVEAYSLGESILDDIDYIIDCLKNAKEWGVADIFFSKSLTTVFMKHSNIDKAKTKAKELNVNIDTFQSLLEDIELNTFNLNFPGFYSFLDLFSNSLLLDLFIQDKINDNIIMLKKLAEEINQTLIILKNNF